MTHEIGRGHKPDRAGAGDENPVRYSHARFGSLIVIA